MKKVFLAVGLACMMAISGCSSGNSNSQQSNNSNPESADEATGDVTDLDKPSQDNTDKEVEKPVENVVLVGDTITTDSMEIVINKVELTYDVLPDDTSGFYTHYPADSGYVYIDLDVDVKNVQKQDLMCDEILKAKADYNDGFEYTGMAIVDDSSTGFTYANISSISPLATRGMHYIFSCPQEVEETDYPLFLTISPNGTTETYKLVIR